MVFYEAGFQALTTAIPITARAMPQYTFPERGLITSRLQKIESRVL